MGPLRVGLVGWGTVGAALGQLIGGGPLPLTLRRLAVRDPSRPRSRPLPAGVAVVSPEESPDRVDVVVELAGGIEEPAQWAQATLERGLPYVTANKALLANHGADLADIAREHRAALLGSAAVGGGTPMIEVLTHLSASGGIKRIRGVLNATSNYILTRMGQGRSYEDALREAQDAGYAEADPSADVEGRDAAQKLAILASIAWRAWRSEHEVEREGITGVTATTKRAIRLIADGTPQRLSVGPVEVKPDSPLACAVGIENVLEIDVESMGTLRISGPGAGGDVTARAVYGDLARLVAGERPVLFG